LGDKTEKGEEREKRWNIIRLFRGKERKRGREEEGKKVFIRERGKESEKVVTEKENKEWGISL